MPQTIDDSLKVLSGLRKAADRALREGDLDDWVRALVPVMDVAEQLRLQLLKNPIVISRNPALRPFLPEVGVEEFGDSKREASNVFFDRYNPDEYFARLVEVNTLIVPSAVPRNLSRFLEEVRQCYALGLDVAVQSLCRTVLEVVVNDIAIRIGKLQPTQLKPGVKLPDMRTRLRWIAGENSERIYEHYKILCEVVHGRASKINCSARVSLAKTLALVATLYESNKDRMDQHVEI